MTIPATEFAPAARAMPEEVEAVRDMLGHSDVPRLLDAIPVFLVLLNPERQIVYANARVLEVTRQQGQSILGMRPGEAFHCIHRDHGPCGCGTSQFCSRCGAVRSILMGINDMANTQECSLIVEDKGQTMALDLLVSASPLEIQGRKLVLFTLQDAGSLGRRRNLEHLFFHDVLNTVGSLRGLMDMLRQQAPVELREDADFIHDMLGDLVEELLFHKQIMAAEKKELTPVWSEVHTGEVLDESLKMGLNLQVAEGRRVVLAPSPAHMALTTDPRLLRRVIGNMIKNALEASQPGQDVLLGCEKSEGGVAFWVKNESVMGKDVQSQMFRRNFSTKGLGRGLGGYGMKLLGEGYLKGRVTFRSETGLGTVFTLWLPLTPPEDEPTRP